MPSRVPTLIRVTILGGDPIIGQALVVLLQAAGYSARFLDELVADSLGESLLDAQLLLLTPGWGAKHRETFLNSEMGCLSTARVPVLQLTTVLDRTQPERGDYMTWPCPIDKLKQKIELLCSPDRAESA